MKWLVNKNFDVLRYALITIPNTFLSTYLREGKVKGLLTPKAFSLYIHLSHNNPCFQCNIAITNFLVSHTCEIRFHDVIGQSTVRIYCYAKVLKHC